MLESCRLRLNTPKGDGALKNIYLSELGYLMVKIENDDKTFTTYNLGKPKEDLSINDLIKNLTND